MQLLNGKSILLGVTGGIAAYKTPELVRRLKELGADVQVAMTTNAEQFVAPLALQAVSGRPPLRNLFESSSNAMEHIDYARWADLVVIAPATANFIAKLAHGIADDMLSAICLATTQPIALAPAMNQAMWANAATRTNVQTVNSRGIALWGPASGSQACGEVGEGRMLEPAEIVKMVLAHFKNEQRLAGKSVLITAGPTREAIDPVRYISNRSSGKMGFAIAEAAAAQGAQVTLVSGPVSLTTPTGVIRIDVETAEQMRDAVMQHVSGTDIFVATAAVADYRPADVAPEKIKKNQKTLSVELTRNPDILTEVATSASRPFCVGFAAETTDLEQNARKKLQQKHLDMIAANWVGKAGDEKQTGFDHNQNALIVITNQRAIALESAPKKQIAVQLLDLVMDAYETKNSIKNP